MILSNSHQEYAAKVERAFAAELLAPAQGIAEIVDGRVTEDRIALGVATFEVSTYVVEHQLDNQVVG